MTTVAASLPRPNNFKLFFLIIIVAFIAASFGAFLTNAWLGSAAPQQVTVKPCATCPSCVCKPLLGGPRCGCPQ
jgi:hypothetical protein